jgi:hypothetical protein
MTALLFNDIVKSARLKNIKVDEVSLVDRPANKGARVVLLKRADEGEKMSNYRG